MAVAQIGTAHNLFKHDEFTPSMPGTIDGNYNHIVDTVTLKRAIIARYFYWLVMYSRHFTFNISPEFNKIYFSEIIDIKTLPRIDDTDIIICDTEILFRNLLLK